ncbi:MAG: phage tail terminator family protein [Fusobacteriaceae bacterium]
MTSFRKILASIVNKLEECSPGIEVQTTDIEEGINRPCFYIDIKNVDMDNLMGNFDEKNIAFDILYFPKDKKNNTIDILERQLELAEGFNKNRVIKIDKEYLAEAEKVKLFEVDKVLHLTFELSLSEEYLKEEKELMEDLKVKGGEYVNK